MPTITLDPIAAPPAAPVVLDALLVKRHDGIAFSPEDVTLAATACKSIVSTDVSADGSVLTIIASPCSKTALAIARLFPGMPVQWAGAPPAGAQAPIAQTGGGNDSLARIFLGV